MPALFPPAHQAAVAAAAIRCRLNGHHVEEIEVRDGARAVEVSAMFEDAVLEVRLFQNPAVGEVLAATKGLLAIGGGGAFGAFVMFIVAFVQVGAIRDAREAWDAAGKPYHEFKMPRENPATDIVSGGLARPLA